MFDEFRTKGIAYGILFGSYVLSILAIPFIKNYLTGTIANPILLIAAAYAGGFVLMFFVLPRIVIMLMKK